MGVKIYSKEGCTYCDEAAALCVKREIDYEKVNASLPEVSEVVGKTVRMYPQIFVNGKYIGDFNDFSDYLQELEPILDDTRKKYAMFPIEYPKLWELYKKSQMSNWTAEEIDLGKDMDDWDKLSNDERHFVKYVLAFFAGSDTIVYDNINMNFLNEITPMEAKSFYAYQSHNEMVHSETYSKLIDKYIRDPVEKKELFNAIEKIPSIEMKARWAERYFNTNIPFGERLFAFACVEGIFFSGSFCAIFWLKKRGLLPGLCFSNELISRDEGMHLEFAVELFNMLRGRPSEENIHRIIRDAVELEKKFIIESLPCRLIGMNSQMMSQYIEYVADRLLKQIGYKTIWNVLNPFDFMENLSLDGKTNFFEKRVGDYGKLDDDTNVTFDEDF
jgi:ribonucleotide reductase beta subunit family protein with ferritin-like domain